MSQFVVVQEQAYRSPWTLMSAMFLPSSHTSTWKQPSMANNLKLKISPSLAPLGTVHTKEISQHKYVPRVRTLSCTHLFFPALLSPPVFWHLALGRFWAVRAWHCSQSWQLTGELWCGGENVERRTPPATSRTTMSTFHEHPKSVLMYIFLKNKNFRKNWLFAFLFSLVATNLPFVVLTDIIR